MTAKNKPPKDKGGSDEQVLGRCADETCGRAMVRVRLVNGVPHFSCSLAAEDAPGYKTPVDWGPWKSAKELLSRRELAMRHFTFGAEHGSDLVAFCRCGERSFFPVREAIAASRRFGFGKVSTRPTTSPRAVSDEDQALSAKLRGEIWQRAVAALDRIEPAT